MSIIPLRHLSLALSLYFTVFTAFLTGAFGYIPALPTNDTTLISVVYNTKDASILSSQWLPGPGSFRTGVFYAAAGGNSSGISTGALVHFSEVSFDATVPGTTTPWIAFIPCDFNSTTASSVDDIFTLAHSKGAVSAVLYTLYSSACMLSPGYHAPSASDRPIDVFVTQRLTSSRLVDAIFSHLPIPGQPSNNSLITYDPLQLDSFETDISQSIDAGTPVSAGYLLTTLVGRNPSIVPSANNNTAANTTTTGNHTTPTSNTTPVNNTTPTNASPAPTNTSLVGDTSSGNLTKAHSSIGTSLYGGQDVGILAGLLLGVLVIHAF